MWLVQLVSDNEVQRELSALETRMRELDRERPAMEAENVRLHSALLRQAQFLPESVHVSCLHLDFQ